MQAPFSTLVNPGIPIPAVTSAIHHLTARDMENAPPPALALEELRRYCLDHNFEGRPHIIVAHNAPFDRGFLPSLHTTRGWPREASATSSVADQPWLCTSRLAKHLYPDAPSHGNQVLRYWLPEPILEGDPALRGLNPHRALADVIITASNLRHMLATYLDLFDRVVADHAAGSQGAGPGHIAALQARPWDDPLELVAYADSPIDLSERPVRFGKHASKPGTPDADRTRYRDLPPDYLAWMLNQDFDADTIHTIKTILANRVAERARSHGRVSQ